MTGTKQYAEKLRQYKLQLCQVTEQIEKHNYSRLNLMEENSVRSDEKILQPVDEIHWSSKRYVRQQLQKLKENNVFLSKARDDLNKNKRLLQKETDPTEPTNWRGAIGEAAAVILSSAAMQATSHKSVHVKGYRKKDGTYVHGYQKTIRVDASEGAKEALKNSLENVGSHRNNPSKNADFSREKEQLIREKNQLIHEYSVLIEKVANRILDILSMIELAEGYIANPREFQNKYIEDRRREAAAMRAKHEAELRAKEEADLRAKEQAAIKAERDRISQERSTLIVEKLSVIILFLILLSPAILLLLLYLTEASLIMAILQVIAITGFLIIVSFLVVALFI